LTTDQRVAALEHSLAEAEAEIDRLFQTLFRLLTVMGLAAPERFKLLEILGLHPNDRLKEP